jgi:hypothetical protein
MLRLQVVLWALLQLKGCSFFALLCCQKAVCCPLPCIYLCVFQATYESSMMEPFMLAAFSSMDLPQAWVASAMY